MPTVSVDTFFACSLMIIVVLSAMGATSKILNPYIENSETPNLKEKYREISKHLLLTPGEPSGWGRDGGTTVAQFGLANEHSEAPYELDIDKVSRLNSVNDFAVNYTSAMQALGLPDATFQLRIRPIFDVVISLVETFPGPSNTTYKFQIATEKDGASVPVHLKCYLIASGEVFSYEPGFSEGTFFFNATLSTSISCSALLAVFARQVYSASATSFGTIQFDHGVSTSFPNGTFLRLSPLNETLRVSVVHPVTLLSDVYALTFEHTSTLAQIGNETQTAAYAMKRFFDVSPTVLVSTGWNSTTFFAEWVSYPQVPLLFGVDLSNSHSLTNAYAFSYVVTIDDVLYDCTIWLGGPVD